MNTQQDLYSLLGIEKTATNSEIKHAYKIAASLYHPDKCKDTNAAEMFKAVHTAYTVLMNPTTRAQYDVNGSWTKQQSNEEIRIRNDVKTVFANAIHLCADYDINKIPDIMLDIICKNINANQMLIDNSNKQISKLHKIINIISDKSEDNIIYKYTMDSIDDSLLKIDEVKKQLEHWNEVKKIISDFKFNIPSNNEITHRLWLDISRGNF